MQNTANRIVLFLQDILWVDPILGVNGNMCMPPVYKHILVR